MASRPNSCPLWGRQWICFVHLGGGCPSLLGRGVARDAWLQTSAYQSLAQPGAVEVLYECSFSSLIPVSLH